MAPATAFPLEPFAHFYAALLDHDNSAWLRLDRELRTRLEPHLVRFVVRDSDLRAELMQTVLVAVYENLRAFRGDSIESLAAWAYRILERQSFAQRNSRARFAYGSEPKREPCCVARPVDERLADAQFLESILALVGERLRHAPRKRSIFVALLETPDASPSEIARRLHSTPNRVRVALHGIRRAAREADYSLAGHWTVSGSSEHVSGGMRSPRSDPEHAVNKAREVDRSCPAGMHS